MLDFDGVSNDGQLCTEAIQEAIEWVSENAEETNILYFPEGVYYTGSLVIKDNVQLYLSSGALILGSDNYDDYKEVYDFPPDQPNERAMGNDNVITTGADGPQADGELYNCTIEDVVLYQTSVAALIRIAFTNRFAVHDITIRNVLSIDNWAGTVIKAENFPGYNYCNPIYNMTFENFIVEGTHNLLSWGIDNNDDTFSYFDNWKFKNISI